MKKIIYINKEVQIGDMVSYNGVSIEVTDKSVEANPSIFKVVDKSLEFLAKAKRDYPIGTKFDNGSEIQTVTAESYYWSENGMAIKVPTDKYKGGGVIYGNGEWAEILPVKFTTEDGVDIYGAMRTYLVHPNDNGDITSYHGLWIGDSTKKRYKYFYHKGNALAYIEKHKEKTLDDYENMLLRTDIDSINAREVCWFYHTLKGKEPKLYYTKILQLIADDLNDGRYIHERRQTSFHINKGGRANLHMGDDEGCVYFKSNELAFKARDILGDKVKYLFN